MTQRLNVLDRLHRRFLDIVATALPLMPSSVRDADLVGLSYLRGEMMQAIEAYGRYVQDHVVGSVTSDDGPDRIRLAQDIKVGSLALERAYQAFTVRWQHRDGIKNWPEYRLSAIVMMKQVRDQVRAASRWEPADAGGRARAG